jgi:soluble lytic murein transglycosylase
VKLPLKPFVKSRPNSVTKASIPYAPGVRQVLHLLVLCLLTYSASLTASGESLEKFRDAWDAAGRGDHESFNSIKDTLHDYVLFPYLQYEDYRNRRASIGVDEMAQFLEDHEGWAFSKGLKSAWLKTLAKKGRWKDFLAQSEGVSEIVLKCQRARAKIILGQTDGLMSEVQTLWTVAKSQPDECNPAFVWLIKNDGIPESLAWERIRLTIGSGNRNLTGYLKRFVGSSGQRWLDDWQALKRGGYKKLEKTRNWPDNDITRMITSASLQQLARTDAELAARKFQLLSGHFNWAEEVQASLLRDMALYTAVGLEDETPVQMERVPAAYRDSQLLEWWARFYLSREDWSGASRIIGQMPDDTRNDDRWQYWLAQARLRSGEAETPSLELQTLSVKSNYYGFLAADELDLPYNICPLQPDVETADIERIATRDDFRRALELRKASLDNWAVNEWSMATARLPHTELKAAAALAFREGWHDRVIFALGNSGDLQLYEWRFPLLWETDIKREAAANKLDPAWVYGTMRSESAMMETARSSANAMGLMQVTPATAKSVAKKHGMEWRGIKQLRTSEGNLPIGTAYMSDLLEDFRHNPVLVSGAYNAGPNAVKRWLDKRPKGEAAIWAETLPYFETRDYIPRVLAFTTIYDWRLGGPVTRVSGRMPHIESGKIGNGGFTEVSCRD